MNELMYNLRYVKLTYPHRPIESPPISEFRAHLRLI